MERLGAHTTYGSRLVYWLAGTFCQNLIFFYQSFGHRAGPTGTDHAAIDLHHGNDLRACSREETFIGVKQIVASQIRFADDQTCFARQLDYHAARNAVQRAGRQRWSEQLISFADENIIARTLRHEPFSVQHDCLLAAGVDRFDLGENVVQIVQRLDGRIQRAVQIPCRRHRDDVHPTLIKLRRIKLNFVRDHDDRRALALVRIQTQAARASRYDEPDVAVADLISTTRFEDGLRDLHVRHRDVQQDRFGRAKQPVNVLLQLKDAAIVSTDAFENTVAVKQPMVEHRDFGALFVVVLAVDVDFHSENAEQATERKWPRQ